MVVCSEKPPVRLLWCWLLFFIHFCSLFYCCSSFISRLLCQATGTPPWLLRSVRALTSSELYPGYFWLLLLFNLLQALPFWVGIFNPQAFFLTYTPTPTSFTQPALSKASLRADRSSLTFAGLHADPQNADAALLFVSFSTIHNLHIQKNSFWNCTKYYHELLVVKV